MKSINMPINIGGVAIKNDDYVLADQDGVVVVPQEKWNEVVRLVLESIEKEQQIAVLVAKGFSAISIFDKLGEF
jgi:regulator of RNase E activity RraA